jgi:Thymosin beta-4 family.
MAAPALKDLPKVAEDLKSQLETFDSSKKLNNTETLEKNVLPTKEGNLFLFTYFNRLYWNHFRC